jgi:hypothetical protein
LLSRTSGREAACETADIDDAAAFWAFGIDDLQ